MNVLVFDIETVPDVEAGRQLLDLQDLPDQEVVQAMLSQTKAATGQLFVKHHLQKIITISAVFRYGEQLKVWSLGDPQSSEKEIVQRFFSGIEKFLPTLVSWNGAAFDLPVLHYRALYHGIAASTYWECGDQEVSFKFNNYLNRYHSRHIDLMDTLAAYQQKAFARLDEIAVMLGFPGKMGMSGNQVYEHYLKGDIDLIRHYCEGDVLNTYLIFLRFQMMRGVLTDQQYEYEIQLTKNTLEQSETPHLEKFLQAWQTKSGKMAL